MQYVGREGDEPILVIWRLILEQLQNARSLIKSSFIFSVRKVERREEWYFPRFLFFFWSLLNSHLAVSKDSYFKISYL